MGLCRHVDPSSSLCSNDGINTHTQLLSNTNRELIAPFDQRVNSLAADAVMHRSLEGHERGRLRVCVREGICQLGEEGQMPREQDTTDGVNVSVAANSGSVCC